MKIPLIFLIGAFLGVTFASLWPPVVDPPPLPVALTPSAAPMPSATPAPTATPTPPPPPTPTPSPTPAMIPLPPEDVGVTSKHIYSEMGITTHIADEETILWVFKKRVLVIAAGFCYAGVDYKKNPAIIKQDGARATIEIAPPEILSCGIRSISYFDGGGPFNASGKLYNQLSGAATDAINRAAVSSDLLPKARAQALMEIELNVRRLGVEEVAVQIAETAVPAARYRTWAGLPLPVLLMVRLSPS